MSSFYHNKTNNQLTNLDLKRLSDSWITEEIVEQAGLFRVDSHEGAEIVGRRPRSGDYAGIVFPNVWPGETRAREYRIRRDNPEIEYKDGQAKEKAKYLSPPGRGNLLYFVPSTSLSLLTQTDLPVIITEGEKKTLALHRLSIEANWHFLPIGLAGVWNWKGIIGKQPGPNGERLSVKGVIADFEQIVWTNRKVYILFDANVKSNPSVASARRELTKELLRRKSEVYHINVPAEEGINGIDDFLAKYGPDLALSLIDKAQSAKETPEVKSAATRLIELCDDIEFFHDQDLVAYATIAINSHKETWTIRSQTFRSYLSRRFYEQSGKAAGSQALQDALNLLEARARFDGSQHEVHTRVAASSDKVYLDLCNDKWEAIEISARGWKLVRDPNVRFRRAKGMLPLPYPTNSGTLSDLSTILNITVSDFPLVAAWLVAALRGKGPYPILIFYGEQGSAKSTTARLLRSLLDPASAPLRSEPKDVRDLMIAARNSLVMAFDNLSSIPNWLSDAMCRLATGGGFATRELYSDSEEMIFDAQRPCLLNGIEELSTRGDLLDRCLIVYLPNIAAELRRTEAEVLKKFEQLRPSLLGALLDHVAMALRWESSVSLAKLPRMADFAIWGTAAQIDGFIDAYSGNREQANNMVIESSTLASALVELAEERKHWQGTASDLLEELKKYVSEELRRNRSWPSTARTMSNALRRLAPNLRAANLEVSFRREGKKRERLVCLEKKGNFASA